MATAALVGPNAILQTAGALAERTGPDRHRVFENAGLAGYLENPPQAMVDETEAARLFAAVRRVLPEPEADALLAEAGRRTGDYILAHRIPAIVRRLLPRLPRGIATRLLLLAIRKHAWTFAGSGDVTVGFETQAVLAIAGNPLATPGCPWHAAVLERLFRRLVDPDCRVRHRQCEARGDGCCRFEIDRVPDSRIGR